MFDSQVALLGTRTKWQLLGGGGEDLEMFFLCSAAYVTLYSNRGLLPSYCSPGIVHEYQMSNIESNTWFERMCYDRTLLYCFSRRDIKNAGPHVGVVPTDSILSYHAPPVLQGKISTHTNIFTTYTLYRLHRANLHSRPRNVVCYTPSIDSRTALVSCQNNTLTHHSKAKYGSYSQPCRQS